MTTAALLCPGPSLPTLWHDDLFFDFELVVGINTVGHRYRTHYSFGTDIHIVKKFLDKQCAMPDVAVVTGPRMAQTCALKKVPVRRIVKIKGDREGIVCPYTMPNALMFCLANVERVEVFGMDWSDTRNDFAGQKGDHTFHRWTREADWLKKVWKDERITVRGLISKDKLDYIAGRAQKFPR